MKKAAIEKDAAKTTVVKPAVAGKGAAATYRRLALALPNTVEDSHRGGADFRIEVGSRRRIFATLAYESRGLGTLGLNPEQQAAFLVDAPEWFEPVAGSWGRAGATLVRLDAPEGVLAGALETAHRHTLSRMVPNKETASKKKGKAYNRTLGE